MKKAVSLTVLACALQTGCSVIENNPIYGESGIIRDRSQDYEKASEGKELEVPPHLRARQTSQGMAIPEIGQTATRSTKEYSVPRPEFFYTEATSDKVSLARESDGEKLILVDAPINDVWPKLKDFWSFNGIELETTDVRNAAMETVWIENQGQDLSFIDSWIKRLTFQDIEGPSKDKLRLTLRPDPADTARTSIRLQHVRVALEDGADSLDWDKQGQNVSYKSDMMFEMLRYLSKASDKEDAPTLAGLSKPKTGDVEMGRDSRGNPVLKVGSDADGAWASVATAMSTDRFDLGTQDKDAGMFYFTYTSSVPADKAKKMGFFEWLHSDRGDITFKTTALADALGVSDDEDAKKIRYTSKVVSEEEKQRISQMSQEELEQEAMQEQKGYKIWFAGKVIYVFGNGQEEKEGIYNEKTNAFEYTGRYQLKLSRSRSGVYLSVLTENGLSAPVGVAEEILWDVKDNLPAG